MSPISSGSPIKREPPGVDHRMHITSLSNPRIKRVVKLRQRSHRDALDRMLVEGFREIQRAAQNNYAFEEVFFCETLFLGSNEMQLLDQCAANGAELVSCTKDVFSKMSYRDRPDGMLGVGPQLKRRLDDLSTDGPHLIVIAEAIEKPGNLGTILRSADAVGATAVLVCDRCTDLSNPNVVRASVGTLFHVPVVETTTQDALAWLRANDIKIVATSPDADAYYTQTDVSGNVAVVMGTEQYGLTDTWLKESDVAVKIPMLGQADSLNVAAATTILLYEVIRQRGA
ncbi:MAG: TrmH family RNA methyltransferase [Candidatus Promineifilaceae bacterium]|jgi:TrmH family RNA methyltransferase